MDENVGENNSNTNGKNKKSTTSASTTTTPPPSTTSSITTRFADYFVICGLDIDTGLEPDRFTADSLHCSPLDRAYKSKPLAHYPENVSWNPFDAHGICMLSLPQGLRFRTQKHCLEPKFHSFATTREDGKRCHGFSLIVYEEVRNRNICSAMHTLQSMFLTELSSGQTAPGIRRVKENPASRSLPRSFKLAPHTPASALSYFDISKDKLYVTKSISLICQVAYAYVAEIFLTNLYKCLPRQPGPGLSLESYVYNILYEVAIPQPGRSIRLYLPPEEPHLPPVLSILHRPGLADELPLMDFSIRLLFSCLGVDCVIQLFTCVLLENQVLLRSADYQKLMIVGECVTALLFPFKWPHVYAPILPAALHHFLDAPVPFIMGLYAECENNLKIGSEATLCYVDIDKKSIQLPEELPIIPHKSDFMMEITTALEKFNFNFEKPQQHDYGNHHHNHHNHHNKMINSFTQLQSTFGGGNGGISTGMGNSTTTTPTSILNSKNLLQNRTDDSMTTSCTLPSSIHVRRKHSLHDMFDWDRPHSPPVNDQHTTTHLLIQNNNNNINNHHQHHYHNNNSNNNNNNNNNNHGIGYNHGNNGGTTTVRSSDALQRIVDIVKRTGVALDDLDGCTTSSTVDIMPNTRRKPATTPHEQYCEDLRLNNSIREIFLNRFVQLFAGYEQFVIMPNQNKDEWLTNRESLQNFDKASFLSDQQQHHRPFLSRFLESQMFATLIDNKIMSAWDTIEIDYSLRLFDSRIKILKKRHGGESIIRAANYEPCTLACETQRLLDRRLNNVDMEVTPPSEILPNRPAYFRSFPILEKSILNQESASRGNSLRRIKNGTKWRVKEISLDGKPPAFSSAMAAANRSSIINNAANAAAASSSNNLPSNDLSPALIAQANWTFVEKLLKDCKSKTKRMLLEKMGSEAIELGLSGEVTVVGVEENTLITSLCDLLEKVWSHGLQNKQGKSALWCHLQSYLEIQECNNPSKNIDPNYLNPDLSSLAIEAEPPPSPQSPTTTARGRSLTRDRKTLPHEQLKPLPESLEFDIKNILAMTDIKTHIGYSRAWVRLALEKKLLTRHFRALLSDTVLLRSLYKRSAFVRCEEEKEQFLYHLLTLNAVDYFCFTNTYSTTKLPYRVVIFPSKKLTLTTATPTAWIAISGNLNETQQITMPKGSIEFVFYHINLGILTTLRIGLDQSSSITKWMVEHIVVRNEVTGHMYKFPCGRWLGRDIDDGSVERLLVGQLVPKTVDSEELVETCRTPPPRARSPSIQRPEIRPTDIQQMLGDCVNAIVKWHYRPSRERDTGSLTNLLCGEDGLVKCMENAFLYGFKSQRLFGRNLYVWDYFVKVKEQFEIGLVEDSIDTVRGNNNNNNNNTSSSPASNNNNNNNHNNNNNNVMPITSPAFRQELAAIWRCYVYLMDEINNVTQSLGKDGKFQLFICLCLREHLLHRMLVPIANCRITQEMYEEQSFMRKKGLLTFLRQILEPLDVFHIVLENSLTQGIPSQC